MNNIQHALYATVETPSGPRTFRIGLPGSRTVIDNRHARFDNAHYRNRRHLTVNLHNGASYPVRFLEMREVDSQGRGLGGDRHWNAYMVPVSSLRIERDRPHSIIFDGRQATLSASAGTVSVRGSNPYSTILDARRDARQMELI